MQYVEMTIEEAKNRCKKNAKVLVAVQDLEVDNEYLYKTGANLYDGNRFAPVFISLHTYWISGIAPAGLETRGAGLPKNQGLCRLRVSVSRSGDTLHIHRFSAIVRPGVFSSKAWYA